MIKQWQNEPPAQVVNIHSAVKCERFSLIETEEGEVDPASGDSGNGVLGE